MYVKELWRYPVKTMAGERLERVELTAHGFAGDRLVHVQDARGKVVTSRSKPRFLAHKATWNGATLVDGRPWDSEEVAAEVLDIAGPGARLVHTEHGRFDKLPLTVITDGSLAAFDHDYPRLRPNLIVGGVEGLADRDWPGRQLRIGNAVIAIAGLRMRCIMTSYDPDTQVQDTSITQEIFQKFEGRLALDCTVVEPGEIAVGDEVVLA